LCDYTEERGEKERDVDRKVFLLKDEKEMRELDTHTHTHTHTEIQEER
jgi:hypothetical protein